MAELKISAASLMVLVCGFHYSSLLSVGTEYQMCIVLR